jgi:hypothetical protein
VGRGYEKAVTEKSSTANGEVRHIRNWETGNWEEVSKSAPKAKSGKSNDESHLWVAFRYKHQIKLAEQTRIPLLAVQAELFRLYFRAWDKTAPIEFNNSVLREIGFRPYDKIRALKILESAGWIAVQWRKRKSPLVTIREGFHLCL